MWHVGKVIALLDETEPSSSLLQEELQSLTNDEVLTVTYAYTRFAPKGCLRPPGHIDTTLITNATWPSNLRPTCYVCGPTSFVEIVTSLLIALGNSPEMIRTIALVQQEIENEFTYL